MGPDNSLSIANTFAVTLEEIKTAVGAYQPTSITTEDELENAKKDKLSLVRMRTGITAAGKKGREASNAYNKAVLSLEKTMLAEITPVEEAFALEIAEYERKKQEALQAAKLPDRMAACARYHVPCAPRIIETMTDDEFHQYIIDAQASRITLLEGTPTVTADTAPETHEYETRCDPKTMESVTTQVASRAYRDWLDEHGYSPATHFISKDAESCTLWKRVSIFKLTDA